MKLRIIFKIEKKNVQKIYRIGRFGGQRIRILLSVLALLAYVFTKISVTDLSVFTE